MVVYPFPPSNLICRVCRVSNGHSSIPTLARNLFKWLVKPKNHQIYYQITISIILLHQWIRYEKISSDFSAKLWRTLIYPYYSPGPINCGPVSLFRDMCDLGFEYLVQQISPVISTWGKSHKTHLYPNRSPETINPIVFNKIH